MILEYFKSWKISQDYKKQHTNEKFLKAFFQRLKIEKKINVNGKQIRSQIGEISP